MNLNKLTLKFLILFSYLNLLIIFDGNISLRYLYDDVSRLIILGQDFFITPIYIVLVVAVVAIITDYFFSKKVDVNLNNIFTYLYNFLIVTFSTLIIFYFLRIYDVSRFLLIIFLITCPLIFMISSYINLQKINIRYVLIIAVLGITANFMINSSGTINKALSVDRDLLESVVDDSEEVVKPISKYLNFSPSREINEGLPKNIKLSLEYELTKHQICCFEYSFYENGGKSVGYIELYEDKLLYITGSGILLYAKKPTIDTDQVKFDEIKNNLKDVITNSYVFDSIGWESIKDMIIINEKIYISYIEEVKNDCVSNSIISADFNFEYLNFEKFYSIDECILRSVSPFNAHQSGGKLAKLPTDEILLTTGDFRAYDKPQDMQSKFGKILKIDINTGLDQIISLGHRNPQGLILSDDTEHLLISEHGPKGGDEINIINLEKVQNYGWPISSYGTHYDGGTRPEAPLNKSHESYGFVEPAWYFDYEQNDLHGISAIEKDYDLLGNNYLVATLKGNIIYEVEIDFINSKVLDLSPMKVGARVRDIEYDKDNNFYYLIMENTPSIGILTKNNK
tara:strand:+ start:36143 stop:37843 length:1701 start_codon:yes stop_codon:yes gene_type:complete